MSAQRIGDTFVTLAKGKHLIETSNKSKNIYIAVTDFCSLKKSLVRTDIQFQRKCLSFAIKNFLKAMFLVKEEK